MPFPTAIALEFITGSISYQLNVPDVLPVFTIKSEGISPSHIVICDGLIKGDAGDGLIVNVTKFWRLAHDPTTSST